jgi:hypothetical protein
MITKQTAERIWWAYTEIEKARALVTEMKQAIETATDDVHSLVDKARGRRVIEMGVPSGSNGHRIFDVPLPVATKVIDAHIKANEEKLKELMAIAEIELKG